MFAVYENKCQIFEAECVEEAEWINNPEGTVADTV